MRPTYWLPAILFAYSCVEGRAQLTSAPAHDWKSSWISSADVRPREESVLHFRKELNLTSAPEHFRVYVSADNEFLLKLNGKYVGSGPSHGDLQHWRYTTYDLAPYLHAGKNLLSATVWNFGDRAPVRQITNRSGFLMDGEAGNPADVKTDATWEVAVESGISTNETPADTRRHYYVASPSENLIGAKYDWDWDNANTRSTWKPASIVGRAAARGMMFAGSAWQLIPDPLPLVDRTEQANGKVVRVSGLSGAGTFPEATLTIPAHQQATLLVDLGHLTTAFPELTFSRGKGSTVTLTYAEALYDAKGNKGNREEISEKTIAGIFDIVYPDGAANRTFLPLDWRTWRFVQLDVQTGDEALDLNRFRSWLTAYPFKELGAFSSDDASLKKIWDIGWLTARLCAHDTYMDTPYWERLQYVGDTRVQSLISYTVAGDDRLARQAIDAFHNSTISDGIVLSHYPASEFQNIPGFSMYWVGMVHDFWMYRNDPEFVRSELSVVRSTLSFFATKQNPNQLLGKLPWWSFVDWADGFAQGTPPQDAQGDSAILSLQYVEALRYGAEIEAALGDKELAKEDATNAAAISAAVYKLCWSSEYGMLADTPEKNTFSQHTNAFAVWLDVLPKADQKAVMQKVMSVSDPAFTASKVPAKVAPASYYYRFYLARALVHAGLGNRYLETLGPWRTMISNGLTTWAEQPEPTRSDSHAWSSHPNYDLLTIVAGITPSSPGFRTVHVEPRLGTLKTIQATMPTPQGDVTVSVDSAEGKTSATVGLPNGVTGVFTWNGQDYPLTAGSRQLSLPEPTR